MNRSNFVSRLLNYYADTGFRGCIMLGDSSDEHHLQITADAIKLLSPKLTIVHRECPGMSVIQAANEVLSQVDTDYSVYIPDDDFLCTPALEQCAKFLELNPDYASAHGLGVMFSLKTGTISGEVAGFFHYRQGTLEDPTGYQRLERLFRNYYVTLFSMHRTETARMVFKIIPGSFEWSISNELLPCALSAISGKAKELDCLYLIRQHHGERHALPNTFDWITSPEWSSSYQTFRDRLVDALVQQDGIGREHASEVVKNAFSMYVRSRMARDHRSMETPVNRVKNIVRQVPGARPLRSAMRSFRPARPENIRLIDLLKPGSKHHEYFMPIYRAITEPAATPVS
jgi:glycosyltransferase domain-containing protein